MTIALLILSSFVLSLGGVWLFRIGTRNCRRLLDIPNERSSHKVPVTRGAGVVIVSTVLFLYICVFGSETNISFVIAALAIAAVSFLDDLVSLPIVLRLAVHFAAASAFIYFSGGFILSTSLGAFSSILFIVWTLNAFNFMDGIDGIAGAQGVAVSIGWLLLGLATGVGSMASLGAILLGACLGFLLFNWPPAKVFLGDVGSTFLGFTFAVLPLIHPADQANRSGVLQFLAPTVFLWLFMFDTIYTRSRQIFTLQPFWKAHRDHLYQRIASSKVSLAKVAFFFGSYGIALSTVFVMQSSLGALPLILMLISGPVWLIIWAEKID